MIKESVPQRKIAEILSITRHKVEYVAKKERLTKKKHNKICKQCDNSFQSHSIHAKFCSQSCRGKYNKKHRGHKRMCKQCGETFYRYREQHFCSEDCFHDYKIEHHKPKKEYIPVSKHTETCTNCGKEYETHRYKSKYCSEECGYKYRYKNIVKQKQVYQKKCRECGKHFSTTAPKDKYCSRKCSRKYNDRRKETSRRGRVKENGRVDWDISIERLMKRDKGVCYLCGNRVNYNDFIVTDEDYFIAGDYYPSIEHLNPIAKGGTHTWDNVKLAHRLCNTYKSDESINIENIQTEQLTLL